MLSLRATAEYFLLNGEIVEEYCLELEVIAN